jgi:anaerobic magnesium-protoporphyrin IX monomethyl ester cyclase
MDNNKIIFIIPPSDSLMLKFVSYQQPINLAYLAAAVIKAGFSAEIWDYSIEGFVENDFLNKINESNLLAIGIHCKTFNITQGNHLAGIIKKHFPGIVTIVGGPHSSALPIDTLKEFPHFDIVVIGEGEVTIVELCRAISSGNDLNKVDGLAFREDGTDICTRKRQLIKNLDEIEYPARHLLPKFPHNMRHSTRGISPLNHNVTEIFTSRGCPGKCIFCAVNVSYGNCVRLRNVDNVLGEVEECISRYNYNHIIIQDDTFTLNKKRVSGILDGFRRLGLKSWSCDSRIDTIDEEMLKEMAASGCKKISFGVESGSDRILKLINKNITVEQVKKTVGLARKANIGIVECTFIIGSHPDETYDDLRATWRLIKEICPDIIAVSVIVPYPGTEVFRMMKERGYINTIKWSDFQVIGTKPGWHTANFSALELLRLQRKFINQYYFSPRYLIKIMSKIRNANDIQYFFRTGLEYIRFMLKNNR